MDNKAFGRNGQRILRFKSSVFLQIYQIVRRVELLEIKSQNQEQVLVRIIGRQTEQKAEQILDKK